MLREVAKAPAGRINRGKKNKKKAEKTQTKMISAKQLK